MTRGSRMVTHARHSLVIRGDLIPPAALELLQQPDALCTCAPRWFPKMLDADCPLHGLKAIIDGRFNIDEHLAT